MYFVHPEVWSISRWRKLIKFYSLSLMLEFARIFLMHSVAYRKCGIWKNYLFSDLQLVDLTRMFIHQNKAKGVLGTSNCVDHAKQGLTDRYLQLILRLEKHA